MGYLRIYKMEKRDYLIMLYDYYYGLFTDKQRKYFEDYCIASLDCVFSCINKYPNSFNIYKFYICRIFIYLYMHIQLFIFKSRFNNHYDIYKLIIRRYLEKVSQFNIFIDDILNYAFNNPEDYDKIKHEVEDSNKYKFIESDSFFNFMLKLMD